MTRQGRYVDWLERHARAIWVATALLVATSAYLVAFHLPLYSDFSYLLPRDAPSVAAYDRLAQRMPARDTTLMLVVAPDPATRQAAVNDALAGLRALDADLVERIEADDAALREFVRQHRHLYTSTADLETARKALAERIADAKRKANPLYIELDDEPPPVSKALDDLRARQRTAEARLAHDAHVSADGRSHVIVIRTAFRATDVVRDNRLQNALDALGAKIQIMHPGVTVGYAGGVTVTVAEQHALVRGVVLSSLITLFLVALVLFIHLRGVRVLALLTVNVFAATVVAFGAAAITVGHLNAATAFLGAIIAGNGINYGILLAARYREERTRAPARAAMAEAIAGTLRPTLVASLGAAIAYGALAATSFRGFADFALIGGTGMLVCWIASFTVLPLALLRFAPDPRREPSKLFGRIVVTLFGFRRPVLVCVGSALAIALAGVVTWRYVANDPYEYDMSQLRSPAPDAIEARQWLKYSDVTFERGLAGLAGQNYIAVERAEQVPAVVDALRELATHEPIVGAVGSIEDIVPRDQAAKLALLTELRGQIDQIAPELDDKERSELLALRPPDALAPVTARDLPPALAAPLTERDGRVGLVLAVRPGAAFDEFNGRDLIAFADAVRRVRLRDGEQVATAGASVLFADVLVQIQHDGPIITAIAGLGLIVMVVLIVGRSRRAFAVLVATSAGSLGMIAISALAGIKINFLDYVALPITLGLGIDYAINVADRAAGVDTRRALRTTGGTVFVCSLTTIIGYASLLVSDNLAIRGFGLASLIGEITCVTAALVIVPAIMALPSLRPIGVGSRDAAVRV